MMELTTARHEKNPQTGQYELVGENRYRLTLDGGKLIFDRNGKVKAVPVVDMGGGFVYQIRKTKINADGGAAGLYKAMDSWNADGMIGLILTVFNRVFDYMTIKEAKV